jgi:hypothetical protein
MSGWCRGGYIPLKSPQDNGLFLEKEVVLSEIAPKQERRRISSPVPKNRTAGRGFFGFSRAPFLLPTFLSGEERKVGYQQ